ncbi:MAG: hypothetical protein LBB38_02100 [Puniceicoccales bacterium]|jgi:hypothetical protein|nr:hypothetical protein [Puniceicoccales bacterium]
MARKSVKEAGDAAPAKRTRKTSHGGICRTVDETQSQLGGSCFALHFCCGGERQHRRIVANIDVGFGNWLTIRGHGGGLSWERGIALENNGPSEWSLTIKPTGKIEFKLLLNDVLWERGDNHICNGNSITVVPSF